MRKIFFMTILIALLASGCSGMATKPSQPPTFKPTQLPATLAPIQPPATATPTQLAMGREATASAAIPTTAGPRSALENDACGNPFYPAVNGAWWQYSLSSGSMTRHALSVNEDQTFTILIVSEDINATIEGSCTADGIILLEAPGASGTFTSDGGTSTMKTTNQDGVTLPNDVQVGDNWSQTIQVEVSGGELTFSAIINMAYRAVRYEIVDTPDGPVNALKVEQSGSTSMNGSEVMAMHGFIWYGQGIGVVKNVIDNTSEANLVGYEIPQP